MRGIISIIIGVVLVVEGATGRMVLIGTHSSNALVAFGVVIALIGIFRTTRAR
jgi:hypothetical protein